ncbi:hypothetical protein [Marinomonas primoryensis]|uniref:hypothetical protein n=1 Tax=Marinomonas primoryensis TaxID=178399 RepID=UPI003703ECA7
MGAAINLNSAGSGFSGVLPALLLGAISPEYDADLEAIEGIEAPDSSLAGMTTSAAPTTASDEKRDEAEATEETTTTVSGPILQSSVLKVSVALEQLAKNAGPSYQKGSTEAEDVKRIQQALLNMDFNLGPAKV